jgi:hypothetical protein
MVWVCAGCKGGGRDTHTHVPVCDCETTGIGRPLEPCSPAAKQNGAAVRMYDRGGGRERRKGGLIEVALQGPNLAWQACLPPMRGRRLYSHVPFRPDHTQV